MDEGNVTLYIATSVDGFIATDDGGVAWLEEFPTEVEGDAPASGYDEFFAAVECLVMGSNTYEQVLGFGEWPYEDVPAYVTTRRDLPRASGNVQFCDGDVSELAEDLRDTYEHIWLVGGAQLARSLLQSDQIDELYLSLVPVLLGSGVPLFDTNGHTRPLHLLDSTVYGTGIVEVRYRIET